ncbi:MAG: SDR family NAD(P)-dependent oxidoreductase [Actinophytocola sp.]|uniref:SDR family oxidoreductase n=1 Tax=Actinophytocola sp. TaxID=1872138 RepID=UPI001324F873|nr:SDR family oxidoreductase [Actinophytocola sp.]MPZ79273.1 SDR family NAD(P)-dependent oxidoreductase [Actinophytocola sp.]
MTPTDARNALITGGSRGLGYALAAELVRQGWRVVIDARDSSRLAAASAAITGPGTVIPIAGDVADPAHRAALAGAVTDLGGLDLLVNNASILGPSPQPTLADYPLDVLAEVYATNTIAPLALIQLVLPQLTPRKSQVVNITSDAAVEPYEGWGGYGSSKAALDQITNILAAEQPELRVYAVDPGDMATDLHQQAFPGEDISDRAAPESVVPALLRLIADDLPSGRYRAADLAERDEPAVAR